MLRRIVISLAIVIVIAGLYAVKAFTPPLFGSGAIARLTSVEIDGSRQALLIRGHDRDAPVLLFLHGGPGMPAMYLGHAFQRELERHFMVVHWDQRGAGKSYSADTRPEDLSISRLLSDTLAVTDYLDAELGSGPVYLVGHSHGSYLGALFARRHPERVRAFIGVGQVTDPAREIAVQDAYLRSQLAALDLPPDTEITGANRESLLFETGSELHGETSFLPLILTGLMAPEYNLLDVLNVARGSSFSSRHMTYDEIDGPLMEQVTRFEVPVAIVMGRHDMVTPVSLAQEYYERIEAPAKRWHVFEASAHFPFFEEPDAFTNFMLEFHQTVEDRSGADAR